MLDYGAGTGKLLTLLHRGVPLASGRVRGAGLQFALPPHVALAGCDPRVSRPKHWAHWDWGVQVGQGAPGQGKGSIQCEGGGAGHPTCEEEAAEGKRHGQQEQQHQQQERDEQQPGMKWSVAEGGRLVGWGTDCAAAAEGVGSHREVGGGAWKQLLAAGGGNRFKVHARL